MIKVLRGAQPPTRMKYSTFQCCGTRIDTGHFYVAFLKQPDEPFRGHFGNLLKLGETYAPGYSEDENLNRLLEGGESLEAVYGESPSLPLAM